MKDIEMRTCQYLIDKANSENDKDIGWAFIAIMTGIFDVKTGGISYGK